jgi:hypothetical protein
LTTADRIAALDAADALEATQLLAGRLFGAKPDDEILKELAEASGLDGASLQEILDSLSVDDVDGLCRAALLTNTAESAGDVEAALDSTGQKAVLLEIFVIAQLALAGLNLAFARGRSSTSKTESIRMEPDGTIEIKVQNEVKYAKVSDAISPVVGQLLGGGQTGSH